MGMMTMKDSLMNLLEQGIIDETEVHRILATSNDLEKKDSSTGGNNVRNMSSF